MSEDIELGDKVEDIVTGIQGIAVARVEYLNGCIQYCIQPRSAMDALKTDSLYIDQGQIKRLNNGINRAKPRPKKTTHSWGGPSAHAPKGLKHP